jgi:hypothetical protein
VAVRATTATALVRGAVVAGAAAGAPGPATTGVRVATDVAATALPAGLAEALGGAVLIVTRAGVPNGTGVAESVPLLDWIVIA